MFDDKDKFTIDQYKNRKKSGEADHDPVTKKVFTLKGNHDSMYDDIPSIDSSEDSPGACAMKKGSSYFIRINNRGDFFNPLEPNHVNSARRHQNNIPIWKYKKVGYHVFADYAHFLKTRNTAFLARAQREVGQY